MPYHEVLSCAAPFVFTRVFSIGRALRGQAGLRDPAEKNLWRQLFVARIFVVASASFSSLIERAMKRSKLVFVVSMAACMPQAAAPPTPHSAMSVNASYGKTWDAVIDTFASNTIPIKTLERASGFVAAEVTSVGTGKSEWADCGKVGFGIPVYPDAAFYNVRVKGDSLRSTVQVTVSWHGVVGKKAKDCSTKGVWETDFETAVRERAEGKRQ
jgi:hypothetical protein